MTTRLAILLAGVLGWLPLAASAAQFPAEGTIRFEITDSLPPVATPVAGVATVNGTSAPGGALASLALTSNAFATTGLIVDVTDPAAAPIQGQLLTASGGAGNFSGSPISGTLPLAGTLKICLFLDCDLAPVPANLTFPLSVVGVGGTTSVTGLVGITVAGAPWTTGTVNVGTSTRAGGVHGPLSATSTAATAGGSISLVTPIFISTSIAPIAVLPGFAILDLTFVPEPTTALLLGAGVVALALRGRHASPGRR